MAAFLVALFWATGSYARTAFERRRAAETALFEGQSMLRYKHYEQAERSFQRGADLAESIELTGASPLSAALAEGLRQAQRAQQANELHDLANLLRFYLVQDYLPRRAIYVLDAGCRQIWKSRAALAKTDNTEFERDIEQRIRADLLDVAIVWGKLQVRAAEPRRQSAAQQFAFQLLDDAEALYGPNVVLANERHRASRDGTVKIPVWGDAPNVGTNPTVWELYALGRTQMENGDTKAAKLAFGAALAMEPLDFTARFYHGLCAMRLQNYAQAVSDFSLCAGQSPKGECFLYRGLAEAALGLDDQALIDFGLALGKSPNLGIAWLQRAELLCNRGSLDDAYKDLQFALKNAADPIGTNWQLARVRFLQRDLPAAGWYLLEAIALQPMVEEMAIAISSRAK